MREIKFRAKMIDSPEEWVYGSLVYNCGDECYIVEHCDEELSFPVITETVGQYVGLQDYHGREIFEGDIVRIDNNYESEVIWSTREGFCITIRKSLCDVETALDVYKLEVIGGL